MSDLCGTAFLLLYGDRRWSCILSSDNWKPICSTSDVSTNRRNIHHHLVLFWRLCTSGTAYKTPDWLIDLLTYLLYTKSHCKTPYCIDHHIISPQEPNDDTTNFHPSPPQPQYGSTRYELIISGWMRRRHTLNSYIRRMKQHRSQRDWNRSKTRSIDFH